MFKVNDKETSLVSLLQTLSIDWFLYDGNIGR